MYDITAELETMVQHELWFHVPGFTIVLGCFNVYTSLQNI